MSTRLTHRPTIALRHCRLPVLSLWVFLLTPWMAFAQAFKDQPADQELPPPPAPVVSSVSQPSINSVPLTVRGPDDPDYWVVSTRRANNEVEAGMGVNYDVFRFDGPNPGVCSSIEQLQASLQPGVPVCFMVHGSFVTFESILRDSAKTYQWLRQAAPCQPVHLIFYTWSSDAECLVPYIHVNKLGRRASLNGFYLAEVISKISADHPVCLLGHSHGTRMVSSALHSMSGGDVEGRVLGIGVQPNRRIRVVLAAAAIDHDWLNPRERYGRALCQAECVLNLRNHADFPLQFYPLRRPIAGRALAITGLTYRDRSSMGDWNQKIIDYDVTEYVGMGHIWSYYISRPEIASAIRHYVYFDEPRPPVVDAK